MLMIPHRESAPDIPPHTINELSLFAEQPYFASQGTYKEMCKMPALYPRNPPENVKDVIDATDFVRYPHTKDALGLQRAQFSENSVSPLRALMGLRREGQDYLPRHLRQVFHSREVPDHELSYVSSQYPKGFILLTRGSLASEGGLQTSPRIYIPSTSLYLLFFIVDPE